MGICSGGCEGWRAETGAWTSLALGANAAPRAPGAAGSRTDTQVRLEHLGQALRDTFLNLPDEHPLLERTGCAGGELPPRADGNLREIWQTRACQGSLRLFEIAPEDRVL